MTTERRPALELRTLGGKSAPRLAGYAAVFDTPSEDLGGFVEYVRAGAFRRTLQSNRLDPLALVHHMPHLVLGRRSSGTLRLSEDTRGLEFEIDLPDTTTARDIAVSVERGDIRGASFAFSVAPEGDRWNMAGDAITRDLIDVDLHEITITATPAYPDTEVARRALATLTTPRRGVLLARRFLESC